jgi:hypothetical protein
MLNPSTADATQDDPTIRRCVGFAKAWGFTALSVRNLFPWRATDPTELLQAESPTGGERGNAEILAATTSELIVVAWGAAVIPCHRDAQVLQLLKGAPLFCLGTTKDGHPRHPLSVKADTQPQPFTPKLLTTVRP